MPPVAEEATIGAHLEARDFRILAAGQHPLFGDLEPDNTKAYVSYSCMASFPNVIGPEMGGRYFGLHPQVLANSHRSLMHQHTNIGHLMASYGNARRDHITGCVVGVAMPHAFNRAIPESPEDAPRLQVLAVMFKAAQGVPQLLGQHQSGRQKWACSVEIGFAESELGVYDPEDRSITPYVGLSGGMAKAVTRDPKSGSLMIGKYKGRQLAFALGGSDGACDFHGLANTPNPAERGAAITEIRAASGDVEYDVMAASAPEWIPGMALQWKKWHRSCQGRGTLRAVHYSGTHEKHGATFQAESENPVLEIALATGVVIMRLADTVERCQ